MPTHKTDCKVDQYFTDAKDPEFQRRKYASENCSLHCPDCPYTARKMQLGKTAIKEQLPDVKVSYLGEIFRGQLSGREHPYAHVTILHKGTFLTWDYSWDTIARAINNDTALTV